MKLSVHYCTYGFSNCYILGSENEESRDAIIIDPASINRHILDDIENGGFDIKGVLITHAHLNHVHGLRTLKKIYDTEIFAVNRVIQYHNTTTVKDGDKLKIGIFEVEVISIPGHSSDSAVYRIENLLFTGDVLTAGLTGRTASAYGETVQINNLRSKVLSLPGDYTVLPGHGPPSSLDAERRFNAGITAYDINRVKRPVFKLNI
ncbi:MAG TPA: MBL fold hydrolase [Treponema sp.]|nr:MBL fold hydrolase [Treponema sp.]